MHATKDRVESDTSTVYSISLYESTITTRDEPWFGELKLALGVIGLPVTVRDRILRCSPPVVGTTRAGPRFRKVKGQKVVIGGYEFPISLGAENESTSRFDNTFFFLVGKERRSPSEPSNEE